MRDKKPAERENEQTGAANADGSQTQQSNAEIDNASQNDNADSHSMISA